MRRVACLVAASCFIGVSAGSQNQVPQTPKKLANGVYAILRDSLNEKDVLPLKDKEALVVHQHRYLKKDDKEPPRYLVVRSTPDVDLDLVESPKAVKEGEEVVRILLKLRPKAAVALERLTSDRLGQQITIVLGGEVVTMHKIREIIKGGEVQITSCAAGAANYLLEQLQNQHKKER